MDRKNRAGEIGNKCAAFSETELQLPMPRIMVIKAPDGSSYKIVSTMEDVIEKQSPAMWFGAYVFFKATQVHGLPNDEAKKLSFAVLREWVNKPCPDFLLALFNTNSKKQQESLLRNQSIKPEDLICWILQSGSIGGLFSQYSYDGGVPIELKGRTPIMIDASSPEQIKAIGATDLSDAALMHLVENLKIVIAQIVDLPDDRWYCFFRTHRGLAGRESGNHGQHMHFISSSYGFDRDKLVEGFKRGDCPKKGFHVHLRGYWRFRSKVTPLSGAF